MTSVVLVVKYAGDPRAFPFAKANDYLKARQRRVYVHRWRAWCVDTSSCEAEKIDQLKQEMARYGVFETGRFEIDAAVNDPFRSRRNEGFFSEQIECAYGYGAH